MAFDAKRYNREYQRKWSKNPKRVAYSKAWYQANKDRIKNQSHLGFLNTPYERLILRAAKARAKRFNLEFNLVVGDIIIPTECPILKIPLVRHRGIRGNDSPSLDRLDNSKGYIKGNVWIISNLANSMKTDASLDQLRKFGEWAINL